MSERAYATLVIKAMQEDGGKRRFAGVATTPTADRVGDIVEPKGAQFKLPVPLLWQHRQDQPIGWIRAARVTDTGIDVECEVATVDEPGKLKDRVDEAWQSIKSNLVQGLSIGFKPIESARIGETYAFRYLKWLWLELSAVTVPANMECSITTIKSADVAIRRAALGAGRIVRLDPAPAATGTQPPGDSGQRRKGVVYLSN